MGDGIPAGRVGRPRGRVGPVDALLVLLAGVTLGIALVHLWSWSDQHRTLEAAVDSGALARDLDGTPVVLDGARSPVAASRPVGRFVAPRQGVDVPLLPVRAVDGVVEPPTFTDAFIVAGHGTPRDASTGRVVVALHSVRGGRGPGNAFVEAAPRHDQTDGADSRLGVRPGDPIVVDGVAYTVTAAVSEGRDAAARDHRIWGAAGSAGADLVVMTCLLDRARPMDAQDNLVVFARRGASTGGPAG